MHKKALQGLAIDGVNFYRVPQKRLCLPAVAVQNDRQITKPAYPWLREGKARLVIGHRQNAWMGNLASAYIKNPAGAILVCFWGNTSM